MTRDELVSKWKSLTPRERDAWISVVACGWEWTNYYGNDLLIPPPSDERINWCATWEDGLPNWLPHYSTSSTAIGELVSTIDSYRFDKCIKRYYATVSNENKVTVENSESKEAALCLAILINKLCTEDE
ncbi:hypothetical protein M5X17_27745 [Paenibacillus alvei]|uniref:hypothetical protein n=1 Tax=Paenibacillus alvei TaxID=44250 RepID=UPI00227F071D|nr:hypothetical protein [Paenibacillus alvei]MCY9737500.1 hypothetical protein [Paenibacillus alvei]